MGFQNFKEKSDLLRFKREQNCNDFKSDFEWFSEDVNFFSEPKFFTNSNFEKLNDQKTSNLLKLKKDLKRVEQKELNQASKV